MLRRRSNRIVSVIANEVKQSRMNLVCFVVALLAMTMPTTVGAQPLAVTARAYIVLDEQTGAVLAAHNADLPHPAASLTKIMSAVIFLERHKPWAQRVKMLKADEVGGGRLRLKIGSVLTVRDLFYAALVGSANNSTNTLVRVSGLSRKLFIHEMNVRAAVLGMRYTTFRDASGMDPGNTITARDMALLARYAFRNPDIGKAVGTAQYEFKPVAQKQKKTITNTNLILGQPAGGVMITGGKTGYLDEADYNLVVRARDAIGREYIIVVLGAESRLAAADDARALATSL